MCCSKVSIQENGSQVLFHLFPGRHKYMSVSIHCSTLGCCIAAGWILHTPTTNEFRCLGSILIRCCWKNVEMKNVTGDCTRIISSSFFFILLTHVAMGCCLPNDITIPVLASSVMTSGILLPNDLSDSRNEFQVGPDFLSCNLVKSTEEQEEPLS